MDVRHRNHLTLAAHIQRWRKCVNKRVNELYVVPRWELVINIAGYVLVGFLLGLVLSPLWRAWR